MEPDDSQRLFVGAVAFTAYVVSVIGEAAFVHLTSGQPIKFLAGVGILVVGPIVAALLVGRPPVPVVLALVPTYYVIVALSVSGYDESRWSYSRITVGLLSLAVQLIAAYTTLIARHVWLHSRYSN